MDPKAILNEARLPAVVNELSARMAVILAESERKPETFEVHALMDQLAKTAYLIGLENGLREGQDVIRSLIRS